MANIIVVEKPHIKMDRGNSGVIRIDGETAVILRELAFQAHMSISAMASNLIKYAAADTIIELEEENGGCEENEYTV